MRAFLSKEGDQVGRFLLVGGVNVILYNALFFLFTGYVGIWYVYSAFLAFGFYFPFSFYSQKYWVFKNMDQRARKRQLFFYSIIATGNWALNTFVLYQLVEYFNLSEITVQLAITFVMSVVGYFVFRWVFLHKKQKLDQS